MIRGARSSAVVALLVIAAGLALAACGSSKSTSSASASGSSTTATGTTTTGARGGAFANLTATQKSCLKSHGVTIPTGGTGGFRPGSGTGTFTRPAGTPPTGTSTTGAPSGGFPGGGSGAPGAAGGTAGGGFGGGAAGGGTSKFATAFKACGIKTTGFGGGFRAGAAGRAGAKVSATAIKQFAACVNKHGYKLTNVNTSGTGSVLSKSLETNKKFLAAAKSCYQYLQPSGATGAPSASASNT